MILAPKPISPGWARRWTRQSVDLFFRAPDLALGVMAMFALVNAFVPQPFFLGTPITVFCVGLLFASLRAADRDSAHALSATFHFLRQTIGDLARLARDAYVVLLIFGFALGVLFALYHQVTHGAGTVKPSPAFLDLPGWLRNGCARESGVLALGVSTPGTLPLVFLTMSLGNQILLHYYTGFRSCVLNWRVTYAFAGILLLVNFLSSVLTQDPSRALAYALFFGTAAAFWWFGAWGYLWCRETFEGIEENARKTVKAAVGQGSPAGAGA
jgi:hypothetical protein